MILLAPRQTSPVSFRVITVPQETKAAELRARIVAGEPFEKVAKENSTDSSASSGGLMGPFALADLRPELRAALSGLSPGDVSTVVKIGNEFYLLQLIASEELAWATENTKAMDSLDKGRYAEAVQSFSTAVQLAEKFGPDDSRLGQSLSGLAETYRLQEDFSALGALYRRLVAIRWSADSNKGSIAVPDLVDRFSDVVSLAYFRGNQFEAALKKFQEALNQTPGGEALYLAMSSILVKAELTAEAENVMQRAVRAFQTSRRVRYKEAEMYRDSGKMRRALEIFQEASQMKAPAAMPPQLDQAQLSFIYQRMGGINTDLTQFNAAIDAYEKALEISPENADARIALGDVYLRRGQRMEALAEYTHVLTTHSEKAGPHYRVADAHLQMGDFPEAAEAAARALKIDPQQRKARFVRGTALMRMGRTEEGQRELQDYQRQEAEAQSETNEQRDLIVSNRGASALVLDGRGDDAVALFRKSIDAHPEAGELRLNLGLALAMLGRHSEASRVLETLLDGGSSDNFLVYKALAREYESLKNDKASQKYGALYIQKIDEALEKELQ